MKTHSIHNLKIKQEIFFKIKKEIDISLKILSANKTTLFKFDNMYNNIDFSLILNRELIDNFLKQYLSNIDIQIEYSLKKLNLKMEDIDSIEILGGISRIPCIYNYLKKPIQIKSAKHWILEESISKGCTLYTCINNPNIKMKLYTLQKFNR